MMKRKLVLSALLGLAAVLVVANASQAQGYFYGYYYPDEHRFNSSQLNTQIYDYTTITPAWNSMHDTRSGYSYPKVPTNTPMPTTPSPYPSRPLTQQANIRVIVPNSQAVVWFGGYKTQSTGTERTYQTPTLKPGTSYDYQVRVAYTQAGQNMIQERTIRVTPGQPVVVDFNSTMATAIVAR